MEWNKLTSSSGVQTKTSSVDAIFDSVLTISMRSLQVCWKNILNCRRLFTFWRLSRTSQNARIFAGRLYLKQGKMAGKAVKSIQELGELLKCGDKVDAASNSHVWDAFNRIFRVSMKSSQMTIPKSFEAKLTRWFHLPGDVNEEESIKRAEFQTIGW